MNNCKAGFTLVELSIVLVIIGLIISGVLVGRDLIKSSETKSVISQLNEVKTGINAFKAKYGGLPGDLYYLTATTFGFTTGNGTAGQGNGNSMITGLVGSGAAQSGENTLFWNHLSTAGYIRGTYIGTTAQASGIPKDTYPPLSIPGNYLIVYNRPAGNFLRITGITTMQAVIVLSNNLSPEQAYQIDVKEDDGSPVTGILQARNGTNTTDALSQGAASCVNANAYLITLNGNLCQLQILMDH